MKTGGEGNLIYNTKSNANFSVVKFIEGHEVSLTTHPAHPFIIACTQHYLRPFRLKASGELKSSLYIRGKTQI